MSLGRPISRVADALPLTRALFFDLAGERNLHLYEQASWAVSPNVSLADADMEVLTHVVSRAGRWMILKVDGGIVEISLADGICRLNVAHHEAASVRAIVARFRELLPELVPVDGRCPMTFWSDSSHGPAARTRQIVVPKWGAINLNYSSNVQRRLGPLMDATFRPSTTGQLILWRGEPGTGKTYALRSLIWEWRAWASFHYVTDPEKFFGSDADYMMEVIMSDSDGLVSAEPQVQRWKVLVLEDSGEMLVMDAKERVGQGLSRLLNVVDGIIGQGLNLLVLVTTNEELGKLHPAIARPGRCLMQLEFDALSAEETQAWLMERGLPLSTGGQRIADLFGTVHGFDIPERPVLGFST